MLLPGCRRRDVGVGLGHRSDAASVDGTESVGDVACSVHGRRCLEAESEDDVYVETEANVICVRARW